MITEWGIFTCLTCANDLVKGHKHTEDCIIREQRWADGMAYASHLTSPGRWPLCECCGQGAQLVEPLVTLSEAQRFDGSDYFSEKDDPLRTPARRIVLTALKAAYEGDLSVLDKMFDGLEPELRDAVSKDLAIFTWAHFKSMDYSPQLLAETDEDSWWWDDE